MSTSGRGIVESHGKDETEQSTGTAMQQEAPDAEAPAPEITPMDLDLAPVPFHTDTKDAGLNNESMSRDADRTGAALSQELEMLGTVQVPSIVRRIAVRSVLWEDIVVEIPSTATMADFRRAIEVQSGGRLREDMLPELVYDGILLPTDNTSIEEAGLTAESAVVGFLAMNVSALTGSAGLELEQVKEKKGKDRRIKIYVPSAPRLPTNAPALEDTTPPHSTPTALPAEPLPSAQFQGFPPPPVPQSIPVPSSDLPTLPNRVEQHPPVPSEAQTPPLVQDQPAPVVRSSALPAGPPALHHTSANVPDVSQGHQAPLADVPETAAYSDASQPLSEPHAEAPQPFPAPSEGQIPSLSSEPPNPPETSTTVASKELAPPEEITPSEAEEATPSSVVGPSNIALEMVDASSQIEPGELHFPLLVLAAVPPHLLQYSMGGDPNPPPEIAAPENAHPPETMEPPASVAPVAEMVVEEAPSAGGGMEVALVPVPYLPPPPVVYGPGGREMVPVDTSRRRKQKRRLSETEEEREVRLRRARKLFTVGEVEALVTAVERLGPGRWREVKERVFSHADHRTYGDLKDKWKTLVKTAQIAPQQRRGVEIPEELLERVTRAHAFWTAQAAKDERLTDADAPPRVHYVRMPQPIRRPVYFTNGAHPPQPDMHAHHHPAMPQGGPVAGPTPPHDGQHMHGHAEGMGQDGVPAGQTTGHMKQDGYHAQQPQGYHLQQEEMGHRLGDPGATQAQGQQGPPMSQDGRPPDAPPGHEQYAGHPPQYVDASAAQHWQQQMHAHYYQQQAYPPQYTYEGAPPPNAPYQQGQEYAHMQPGAPQHMEPAGYHQGGAEYGAGGAAYHQSGEQVVYQHEGEGGYHQGGAEAYQQGGEEAYQHEGAGAYQQASGGGYQQPGEGVYQQGGEGGYQQEGGAVYQQDGYRQDGEGGYQNAQPQQHQAPQGYVLQQDAALNEYLVGDQAAGRHYAEGYAHQGGQPGGPDAGDTGQAGGFQSGATEGAIQGAPVQ
ncbi:hypothetical protein KFL_000070550 [Klebsormidium nitens]|uniref:Uncharacterized protein n=1 Tax=Klebsormidium nitens TaxID=105231 RepID=A0A1Y1HNF9_KLENI|nr:hypothetical protein KFL_000070550 [Klebsormidium nitens]|eukprot:GAQ78087.1 hypothetical protein KFL_000070550 [Klebsormidium nitens]